MAIHGCPGSIAANRSDGRDSDFLDYKPIL